VIRDAGGSVEEWRSLRIGRSGPMEDVDLCGDRATALIEDIWCEKIRGCSYGGGHPLAAIEPAPPRKARRIGGTAGQCANMNW